MSNERNAIRVFISSPSDVRPERLIAERVVQRLDKEFAYHFRVEPVLWEREPLVATRHFQDFENIPPPSTTDIVVVILWSRLGVPLPMEKFAGAVSGKVPVTGTEWEFEDALKSHRESETSLPELLMYRKKADVTSSLEDVAVVHERLAQKQYVEDFMSRWFMSAEGTEFTAASHIFEDATAFEDKLETHLRALLKKRLANPDEEVSPAGIRWHQGSPFRGLLSYDLEHAPVFFGRTRARNELRELLSRRAEAGNAFVLVVGASGSGKSSLVRAGLLSDLTLPGMVGRVALVRHAVFRPSDQGGDLLKALAASMLATTALPELAAPPLSDTVDSLAALLREAPGQAARPIRQGLAVAGQAAGLTELGEARLLVVVDQLEEMFTQDTVAPEAREGFVAALEALAGSGLVWVVATLRSDFFDRLETLPRLAQLSDGARYLLVPNEPAEIGQIIRQPAREAGLRFEVDAARAVGLDEVIREAMARDAGALPLLSFLLDQLWQRRSEAGVLGFAAYQGLGGLEGALGQRAEEVFSALPKPVRDELPAVLRLLVTVAAGAKPTARTALLSAFPAGTPRRALVEALLHPEARLLVADGDAEAAPRVRVAHEALLSHWATAAQQIAKDARDLELRGRLEQAAERWGEATRRDRESLVLAAGLPLQEALDLVKRWGADLSAEITGFVQASRQAARRRKFRLALAGVGAVLSLPVIAGLVWAVMVWQGVRAVEADLAFVRVPAGCFQMGSPDTEAGRSSDEGPVHEVCLKAFDLGKFELTQAQWKRVMVHVDNPSSWKDGNMGGDDQHPVEMVSWDDAQLFLRLMTFFGSHRYRLPSEAEWEYAARAGTRTSRYWGDDVDQGCPYANMADLDIKDAGGNSSAFANCRDGYIVTSPVGSLKPNGFGLHDMIGNVWEWVEDCYKNSYEHAPADGSATTTKDCKARVDRGGSWSGYPRNLRAACRSNSAPGIRSLSIGFRVVRTVTP